MGSEEWGEEVRSEEWRVRSKKKKSGERESERVKR